MINLTRITGIMPMSGLGAAPSQLGLVLALAS
jgi:hypothetical protein